jgi:hypothetical protein
MSTGARRVLRVVCVAVAAMLAGFVAPSAAQAHQAVDVTISSDGAGQVWITAVWSDGHAVTERLNAIMLAISRDGDRVGPVPLQQVAERPNEARYGQALGAGTWSVTVDVAEPAVGHCDADVQVAARGKTAKPSTKVCKAHADEHAATSVPATPSAGASPTPAVATPTPAIASSAAAAPASSTRSTPLLIAVAALALAAIGGTVLMRRRAARTTSPKG